MIRTTENERPSDLVSSDDLQQELLERRYLRKDSQGIVVETSNEMLQRVARAVAVAEAYYGREPDAAARRFYDLIRSGRFLPNSPTLMNAGRENGLLSACFVLPVPDSIEGIFEAVKQAAVIQKAGGGTGFAFDSLRPTGDIVTSSGGTTSGPLSFLRVFSEATKSIQQGAFRRGANMAMMSIEHPDIVRFIAAKQEGGALENFNLSVKVTDSFMRELATSPLSPHVVTNPRTEKSYVIPKVVPIASYTLADLIPTGRVDGACHTRADVWAMVIRQAHATGEPGICFIDRANRDNPTPSLAAIEATNPCGEQPLLPYESCNLGSINLSWFVDRHSRSINWDGLAETICLAIRFLDDVLDVNYYPTERIKARSLGNRKIGLGVMGFADALILLGIRYDSQQAVEFAEEMASFIQRSAHEASEELADERESFPNWIASTWYRQHGRPMRNAACTTIAPTGSISILAGCSSGIEPIFSLAAKRRALDGREFLQIHPFIERIGTREGWLTTDVRKALAEGTPPAGIHRFPQELAVAVVTAHEITPEWHVRVQAACQKHVDSAVSKTVNLPASATVEDVDRTFRLAYELGCKGITVYRDGSRAGQTLSTAGSTDILQSQAAQPPRPRGRVTSGTTSKFRTGCGTLFVTVNRDERGLCEVFANLGKAGGCPSQSEATCRVVSTSLRSSVDPRDLVEQLRGIRCLSTARAKGDGNMANVQSCPDAIARAIEEAIGEADAEPSLPGSRPCPGCGQPLDRESGCFVCQACGYSKCG